MSELNERFHNSRTLRSVLALIIWMAGLIIVRPYSISIWSFIILAATWAILETVMYGWSVDIDI